MTVYRASGCQLSLRIDTEAREPRVVLEHLPSNNPALSAVPHIANTQPKMPQLSALRRPRLAHSQHPL